MIIHKKIIVILFLSIITVTVYGQGFENTKSPLVYNISQTRRLIDNYKKYDSIVVENSEAILGHSTDNGASLTGYYKNDTLKKITEWIGLSNKVIQHDYYIDKEKLIVVYATESNYRFNKKTQSFDYSKLDIVFKGRYYFDQDKLIGASIADKKHKETKQEDALLFLSLVNDYIKILDSKRNSGDGTGKKFGN